MKRTILVAALAGLFVAPAAFAQRLGDDFLTRRGIDRAADGRLQPRVRLSPIRALLLKRVEKVSWEEAPFREVLDWVKAQSTEHGKVNVTAKWRALLIESVEQDTPVTIDLEDVNVAEVLAEVLDQLSDLDPITYIGINNRLKISTKSDFDSKLFTKIYNVDDIFFKVRNFRGSPQIDLNQRQQNAGGGGGGGQGGQAQVQSIFGNTGGGGGNDDDDDDEGEDDERADEIIEWIQKTIEPDSWEQNAGLGTAAVFNKMLTVRNTLEVHELLGGSFRFDD